MKKIQLLTWANLLIIFKRIGGDVVGAAIAAICLELFIYFLAMIPIQDYTPNSDTFVVFFVGFFIVLLIFNIRELRFIQQITKSIVLKKEKGNAWSILQDRTILSDVNRVLRRYVIVPTKAYSFCYNSMSGRSYRISWHLYSPLQFFFSDAFIERGIKKSIFIHFEASVSEARRAIENAIIHELNSNLKVTDEKLFLNLSSISICGEIPIINQYDQYDGFGKFAVMITAVSTETE